MSANTNKAIRGIAGLIVLVVLIIVVATWWRDYTGTVNSKGTTGSVTTTGTVSTTTTPTSPATKTADPVVVETAVIQTNGLNFREQPNTSASVKRTLTQGERLTVLVNQGSWLQVRDSTGAVGWISNSPQYVVIEKK